MFHSVSPKTAHESSACATNDACNGEPHVGTLSVGDVQVKFCCPGEVVNPFSTLY